MELLRAAMHKLEKNMNIDTVPNDPRIAFRTIIDKIIWNYYIPSMFHLCETMNEPITISTLDIYNTKRGTDVYKNIGIVLDNDGIRMLQNWPINVVNIVGKVFSIVELDETHTWELYIDDGSFMENLRVVIDKYIWAQLEVKIDGGLKEGMYVQMVGKIKVRYEDISIMAKSMKIVGFNEQVIWWGDVLEQREIFNKPWVIDLSSQHALSALHSVERREELNKKEKGIKERHKTVDVIDLDVPEMNMVENGEVVPYSTFYEKIIDRYFTLDVVSELERVVVKSLIGLSLNNEQTTLSLLYEKENVSQTLSMIVLRDFVRECAVADDATVYRNWKKLRFQQSKQVLLQFSLRRFSINENVIDLSPFRRWSEQIVKIFSHSGNTVTINDLPVFNSISPQNNIAVVEELISLNLIDENWVWHNGKWRKL